MTAGRLLDKVTFERKKKLGDTYGNEVTGPWEAQFTRSAEIRPLRGGETVLAARLSGTQPVLIIVRYDSQTRTITPDWRAVDAREGTVYAIESASDIERAKEWFTITGQSGVAP